jgi:hypothetical protein
LCPDRARVEPIGEAAQRRGGGAAHLAATGLRRELGRPPSGDRLACVRIRRLELPLHGVSGEHGCDGEVRHFPLSFESFQTIFVQCSLKRFKVKPRMSE